jgi:hypothetical protein
VSCSTSSEWHQAEFNRGFGECPLFMAFDPYRKSALVQAARYALMHGPETTNLGAFFDG